MFEDKIPLLFLLPLRLCCGYLALTAGLGKVGAGWLRHPLLRSRIEPMLSVAGSSRIPHAMVQHVLEHALVYSRLLALVELVAGAALLCGLCSRYAALLLCIPALVFLFGSGAPLADSGLLLQTTALLTLSLCSSGRVLGADGLLRSQLLRAAP